MDTQVNIPSAAAQKTTQPKPDDDRHKAKMRKAMQDFEALFVNYLLKTMRKTVQKSEESDSGFGSDMMQEMFDYEMAKHISRSSRLGIGEMMFRQMTGESLPKQMAAKEVSDAIGRMPISSMPARRSVASVSASVQSAVNRYDDIITAAGEKHGVDTMLIKAVIATESAGNPRAISSANAKGLMQLIDSTATMVGVKNVWDPKQNINGGVKYLKHLLDRFDGDEVLALASYNAGPARVEKHKGVPPIPETQQYVKKVMQIRSQLAGEEKTNVRQ